MPDPKALVYGLLVGSDRNGAVLQRLGLGGPVGSTYNGGVGAGISIFADDGVTVLSPNIVSPIIGGTGLGNLNNLDAVIVDVETDPYAQEGRGPTKPLVVVGPVRPLRADPIDVGWSMYDMMMQVEVRVLTRTNDTGDLGYRLDGDATRRKLVDSIRSVMEGNFRNPDDTGTFNDIRVMDNGKDSDEKVGQSELSSFSPLYRTALQVAVHWYEASPFVVG